MGHAGMPPITVKDALLLGMWPRTLTRAITANDCGSQEVGEWSRQALPHALPILDAPRGSHDMIEASPALELRAEARRGAQSFRSSFHAPSVRGTIAFSDVEARNLSTPHHEYEWMHTRMVWLNRYTDLPNGHVD
jgi:hypothetical protein